MFDEMQAAPQIDMQAILQEFVQEGGTADAADMVAQILEQGSQSPEAYAAAIQHLAEMGVDIEDIPQEFDPNVVALLVQIFREIASQLQQQESPLQQFARGGRARRLASYGRMGDTMLAHITPEEAQVLRRRGGSGTINPHTGLPEFGLFKSIGRAISRVFKEAAPILPIAMAFIPGMQGFAATLGSTLGASGAWASTLGNAVIGGLTGGLTGGSRNILPGALMGGLGDLASTALNGGTMPWNAGEGFAGTVPGTGFKGDFSIGGGGAGSASYDTSGFLGGNSSLGATGAGSFMNQTPTLSTADKFGLTTPGFKAPTPSFASNGLGNMPAVSMPSLSEYLESPLDSLSKTGRYVSENLSKVKMPSTAKDYMQLGKAGIELGAAGRNYESADTQAKMMEEAYNQLIAQGADPLAAQQQVQQYYQPSMAFGNMYGSGSLYGA